MKKAIVYAIATEETRCYGHGEYINELCIKQQNAYGPEPAFFHPLFLSREKAEAYCNSLNISASIAPLELDIDSATMDIDATEIIEDESKNRWKAAVIDYLVCAFLLNGENKNDPERAIHDIAAWEAQLALDPLISEKARKLLEMKPEDYPENYR